MKRLRGVKIWSEDRKWMRFGYLVNIMESKVASGLGAALGGRFADHSKD